MLRLITGTPLSRCKVPCRQTGIWPPCRTAWSTAILVLGRAAGRQPSLEYSISSAFCHCHPHPLAQLGAPAGLHQVPVWGLQRSACAVLATAASLPMGAWRPGPSHGQAPTIWGALKKRGAGRKSIRAHGLLRLAAGKQVGRHSASHGLRMTTAVSRVYRALSAGHYYTTVRIMDENQH
jgi:hypothetical protein